MSFLDDQLEVSNQISVRVEEVKVLPQVGVQPAGKEVCLSVYLTTFTFVTVVSVLWITLEIVLYSTQHH